MRFLLGCFGQGFLNFENQNLKICDLELRGDPFNRPSSFLRPASCIVDENHSFINLGAFLTKIEVSRITAAGLNF